MQREFDGKKEIQIDLRQNNMKSSNENL